MGRPAQKPRPEKTELGVRLWKTRTAAGITASKLSKAAKTSRSVVGLIEAGDIEEPSGHILVRLARLLGTTAEWLVSGDGKPPTAGATKAAWAKRSPEKAA